MLAVVVGTLVLTVAGSILLVRRAAIDSAEKELTAQVGAVAQLLVNRPAALSDARVLAIVRRVGSYDYLGPVGLTPEGRFEVLPSPLNPVVMDVPALQSDQAVVGNVGNVVFVARPVSLTDSQRRNLGGGIPAADLPVLLVTRYVHNPVSGLPYFLLVAGIVLVVGAVVAADLARRISAPLVLAVDTTLRIAGGELGARVPVAARDAPELTELAHAINAMGESLARARGLERQFLLSVSHDLRTPLTSIRGYVEALTEGATDDVPGALSVIGGEARRLERLVQDLLDLTRLDARRFSLDIQRVAAAGIVSAVADGFRPEAAGLGLALTCTASTGDGPWVDADPDRLGQIVANLIENALRFAQSGVDVAIAENAGWALVTVVDDGPGISSADLARVFERHFTAERNPGRPVGSGLGLAIVSELAGALGAEVHAESPLSEGRGTRMVLRLPVRPAPDSPDRLS
ncbi:MAG: sensor histidine kinase [Acidimicrobiales bacterium]